MLLSPWDRFLPSSALHSFMCIILKGNFVSTTFIASYYSGDFFAFTFHYLCRKISGHRNTILNPYHISFMGLLAICNDIKERNFLMKRITTGIIFLWMRVLTCVEYPKTPQQTCIFHGSFFVFIYIISVAPSSLSYVFQHFQSCDILSCAEQISSPTCTPGGQCV